MSLKKKVIPLIIVCALFVILNGCFDYEQEITLNEDGSGTITLHYIIGEDMMGLFETSDEPIVPDREMIEQDYVTEGIKLEDYVVEEVNGESHWYIYLSFEDINDLSKLEGFKNQDISITEESGKMLFSSKLVSKSDDMKMGDLTPEEREQNEEMMRELFKDYEFTFILNMPGNIKNSNADMIDGNTAKWVYPLSDLTSEEFVLMKANCLVE